MGIGEQQGEIRFFLPDSANHLEEAVGLAERQDIVDGRMTGVEVGQFGRGEELDPRRWKPVPETVECRGGHHRIAQPVDTADQDTPRFCSGGRIYRGRHGFTVHGSSGAARSGAVFRACCQGEAGFQRR